MDYELLSSTEDAELADLDVQAQLHEAVYKRFSLGRKRAIVALVSGAGLVPMFTAGSFVPSIPQIAKDFNSTGPVINLAVSLSLLSGSVGTMTWATYSGFYGRRPIYLVSLPILALASLGVACSRSVPELMLWRVLQAFGAGGGLSVGAGAIGDIYKLEERGSAMGVFFAACLLGPALAPFAGGAAAHYASWRIMQLALGTGGVVMFALMFAFMPETSQPGARGIDTYLDTKQGWRWVWLNPFKPIGLLRSPNVVAVCMLGASTLITNFMLLVPLSYTIGERYNIRNEAIIGAMFLPSGLGNIIGAPLAGRISDHVVVSWRKRRGGAWVPEDRLRAAFASALVLVPLSVLLAGAVMQFVEARVGAVLVMICLFLNGLGVDLTLTPCSAYYVDIMHSRSAEIVSVTNALRGAITALACAGVLPSIHGIGVFPTNAMSAGFAWLGAGLLWITIQYGYRMRAWVDIGYSTVANN
ncbi:MFS general substrate transporter [Auriscalpium vulgare]|uniref:MFS general substrate transporter n=1 Tax=Auriscalpium vulgare TaxID=40419 RepID=A0ACB8R7Q8_9AGAM|nr:MFS general substrate transporter [Auriscalpium vulgare]